MPRCFVFALLLRRPRRLLSAPRAGLVLFSLFCLRPWLAATWLRPSSSVVDDPPTPSPPKVASGAGTGGGPYERTGIAPGPEHCVGQGPLMGYVQSWSVASHWGFLSAPAAFRGLVFCRRREFQLAHDDYQACKHSLAGHVVVFDVARDEDQHVCAVRVQLLLGGASLALPPLTQPMDPIPFSAPTGSRGDPALAGRAPLRAASRRERRAASGRTSARRS